MANAYLADHLISYLSATGWTVADSEGSRYGMWRKDGVKGVHDVHGAVYWQVKMEEASR